MKNPMLFTTLGLLSACLSVQGQNTAVDKPSALFSMGFLASYYQTALAMETIVDRYHIMGEKQGGEGYQLGLFARQEYRRLTLHTDLTYSLHHNFVRFTNLSPNSNAGVPMYQADWMVSGQVLPSRRVNLSFSMEKHITSHINWSLGPVISYMHPLSKEGYQRLGPDNTYYNANDDIIFYFTDSYRAWSFGAQTGIMAHWKVLLFSLSYRKNISRLNKPIYYQNEYYLVDQTIAQYMLSVGYKII